MSLISENFVNSSVGQRSLGAITRLQSLLYQPSFRRPRRVQPMVIEILGVAGSGKSTFLRQIRRGRQNPSFWATRAELSRENDFLARQAILEPQLLDILKDKIENTRSDRVGTTHGLRHMRNAFSTCFQTIALDSTDLPCHLVEDEGLFYAFRKEIVACSERDPDYLKKLASSRGFVFIRCDPEAAVSNLRRRTAEGGKTLTAHANASDEALLSSAARQGRNIETIVALMRGAGRPVLEIETRGSYTSNLSAFEDMFD